MNLPPLNDLLQPGDLIACAGNGFESDFINVVTYGIPRWSASHVMTVGDHDGKKLLFESSTGVPAPCAVRKRIIDGTQAHEIDSRINGYDGKIWVYKLRIHLRAWERKAYGRFLVSNLGKPYDTPGAFRAGGGAWSWFESHLHSSCLASLFCSEYVASALHHIERFDTDHLSKWSPNALIRECIRRGMFLKPIRLK